MNELKKLHAGEKFPALVAAKGDKIKNFPLTKLFYVWVFNHYEEEFEPVFCSHDKAAAVLFIENWRVNNANSTCTILQLTWKEFMSMSVKSRLEEIAEVLEKQGIVF